MRIEKPHLFIVETLPELLEGLNLVGSFPENRVYLRLQLPGSGLAVKRLEMPHLPTFRKKIYVQAKRSDVNVTLDALVVQHETEFVPRGSTSFTLEVKRHETP